MRAHIHVCERNAPKSLLLFSSLSFSFSFSFSSSSSSSLSSLFLDLSFFLCTLLSSPFSQIAFSVDILFCKAYIAFSGYVKEKSAVFLDFFTLWDDFHPYTYRGQCNSWGTSANGERDNDGVERNVLGNSTNMCLCVPFFCVFFADCRVLCKFAFERVLLRRVLQHLWNNRRNVSKLLAKKQRGWHGVVATTKNE